MSVAQLRQGKVVIGNCKLFEIFLGYVITCLEMEFSKSATLCFHLLLFIQYL